MADQLVLSVAELRRVCGQLLDHLDTVEGPDVRLDRDFFWAIPAEKLYNVYATPEGLTVGQLSESWTNLTAILAEQAPVNAFALVWLADILRAIGQAVVR